MQGRPWGLGHTECFEAFLKRVLWGNVPTHCPFHGLPPSGSGVLPFSCHISDAQRARLMGQLLCVANLEPRSVLGPFPTQMVVGGLAEGVGWELPACRALLQAMQLRAGPLPCASLSSEVVPVVV